MGEERPWVIVCHSAQQTCGEPTINVCKSMHEHNLSQYTYKLLYTWSDYINRKLTVAIARHILVQGLLLWQRGTKCSSNVVATMHIYCGFWHCTIIYLSSASPQSRIVFGLLSSKVYSTTAIHTVKCV